MIGNKEQQDEILRQGTEKKRFDKMMKILDGDEKACFLLKKGASSKVPNNKKQCVLTDCKLNQGQGISGLHSLMKKRNLLLIFFFEAVALNGKLSV